MQMVTVKVRQGTLDTDVRSRGGRGGEGRGDEADIKPNNPHLTGR